MDSSHHADHATVDDNAFVGVPLSVVFAAGETINEVRHDGTGTVTLEPPYHVSDEDAYLLLPDDIGLEFVDILRDGDRELLHEALRDGLLVIGSVDREKEDNVTLQVEQCATPADLLAAGMPYAETVEVGGGSDPLEVINNLNHTQCTIVSALLDDEGLDRILRRPDYMGISWRVPPELAERAAGVDPTLVWSQRLSDGRVGLELALFQEYEELVTLFRPVALQPAA